MIIGVTGVYVVARWHAWRSTCSINRVRDNFFESLQRFCQGSDRLIVHASSVRCCQLLEPPVKVVRKIIEGQRRGHLVVGPKSTVWACPVQLDSVASMGESENHFLDPMSRVAGHGLDTAPRQDIWRIAFLIAMKQIRFSSRRCYLNDERRRRILMGRSLLTFGAADGCSRTSENVKSWATLREEGQTKQQLFRRTRLISVVECDLDSLDEATRFEGFVLVEALLKVATAIDTFLRLP